MCLPSLGTSEPTVRTPDWSRPTGFYPSLQGLPYAYVCYVCLCVSHFSPRRGSRRPGFADVGPIGPNQVLLPLLWHPNFCAGAYPWGKTAKALPTRGEGWPSVLRAYKTPIFATGQKLTHSPSSRGKACGRGDTTTLHSLTPAPAFEGRLSTHHLHSTPARPPDSNPYTRYWVLLSKMSRVLMTLL